MFKASLLLVLAQQSLPLHQWQSFIACNVNRQYPGAQSLVSVTLQRRTAAMIVSLPYVMQMEV